MAGREQRALSQIRVQTGEAQQLYAPTTLAQRIQNFERTPEGTLRAVRGFCPYEPLRSGNQYNKSKGLPPGHERFVNVFAPDSPQTIYGVFHAGLLGGKAPTLVVRAGTKLYRHAGWYRCWEVIYEGLTDEGRAGYPDIFTVVNDTIVWTNGIDPPLVISYDGMVVPLGFSTRPGQVEVVGPQQPVNPKKNYRNSAGYSWPGRVGSVGDVVDTHEGSMLAGRWRYARAWEDVHGNISELSPLSAEVALSAQRTDPVVEKVVKVDASSVVVWIEDAVDLTTKLDDLPRQFVVKATGDAPEHAVATRLYRTPDMNRFPATPRLLERIEGTAPFVYPDNIPDSRLGDPAKNYSKVPRFSLMTSHAGSLVVADGPEVIRSEVGFPGTLLSDTVVTPDADGAVVTGLVSHAGRLLAFTERTVCDITDPRSPPVVMSRGVGCVAPRSIQGLPTGHLVWLSRDGFYAWTPGGPIQRISDPIHRLTKTQLAKGSLSNAVSVIDPESREYRCAVPSAGEFNNDLLLCYDGQGWSEIRLGVTISDMCVTDDPRYLVLFAGAREVTKPLASFGQGLTLDEGGSFQLQVTEKTYDEYDIFVMGHETANYEEPAREYVYESAWFRADDTAITPINVPELFLGMVDEVDTSFDIYIYSNGSYEPDEDSPRKCKSIGVLAQDLIGDLELGAGKTKARRLFWRRVSVGLENVNTWSFKIVSSTPLHLSAVAFHSMLATGGDRLARIPLGED